MFGHLQIYNRKERLIVGAADTLLKGYGAVTRGRGRRRSGAPTERILLLRLERIGDLLMTLGAIDSLRRHFPQATIHLVVGSWNASLAPLVAGIDSFETVDVPWLARDDAGASHATLLNQARRWRTRHFDLAVNFEPDIRSNILLALSAADRRVGFYSGGGGALLTDALAYDPRVHTADNAQRIVAHLTGAPSARTGTGTLSVPADARLQALELLGNPPAAAFLVGIHASGGREIKQWHMPRFADVATRLARDFSGTVVFTGTPTDAPLIQEIVSRLPADVGHLNLAGAMSLPVLGGVLERLNLFITADTGPMHLAAAVRTPTVALFGPSDPVRYGPLSDRARVVTADLWCRPCNRVRRPPERCSGHVPDCLDRIHTDMVYRAAAEVLNSSS